ncbi:efflux RND transporter periplasmic adaptor subunit [Sandarakinorhabdus sp.]|uniref:efflux RND transporter periplasmic adaptor subunit n=1 Tax=Sandarakinorhabdus sp. TaxID=1916663 RepID=UPI00333FF650
MAKQNAQAVLGPAAACLAALLLVGCGGDKSASGPGGPGGKRPPQLVAVMSVPMEDYAPTLAALGTVTPRQSVAVRPRADGEIIAVSFTEGDFVRAGQVLFRLDNRQAQASVQQAQAEVKGAVAAERRARLDFERAEALVAKGFVSTAIRDERRAAAFAARSEIETTRALLVQAQVSLSFLTVKAPISGRTGELMFRLGANVRQGDAALVTINQLSPIHVRFLVPTANIAAARAVIRGGGGKVVVKSQNGGEVLGTGKLVFLDNNVDPGSGGVTARAEFANAGDVMWPGAIVNIEFPLGIPSPHLVVPEGAVQTGRDAPFVWAISGPAGPGGGPGRPSGGKTVGAGGGAKVQMRDVVVVGRLGGKVYLANGLRAGETIVVDALARLKDGDAVRVKPAGAAQIAGRNVDAPQPAMPAGAGD